MKVVKEVVTYFFCYALYIMLIMFFTFPIVMIAYKLGFTIEQINAGMTYVLFISLGLTLGSITLVSYLIKKFKG